MTITTALIIITGLVSYQAMKSPQLFTKLAHWPYVEKKNKEWYRMLTGGFIHSGMSHLLLNLYVFWIFGSIVENQYIGLFGTVKGKALFLLLYVSSILFASLPSYFKHQDNQPYRAVGASGAVSGILLINALFSPWSIWLLFFVIPLPAIIVAIGFLIYEQYASKNIKDNIGHDAHFYGAIYGVLFTIIIKPELLAHFINQLSNIPDFSSLF